MANWRELFKPWILERGQEYFECGQVVRLAEDGPVIRAEVSGTQEYHVEIRKAGGRVAQMECDCPYAAGGENCKHMAAVLFALEDEPRNERTDWQDALEQLPVEKLRDLLRSLAEGDGALQDRIVRMVVGPGNEPEQWREDLEQIILEHTDYRGRLVYGQEYGCRLDIAQYLEESLPYLLIDGRVLDAANLVMTVYETAFAQNTLDEGDGLPMVSETCRNALGQVLAQASEQEERKIFYLLHEFLENSDWDWSPDDLEELILSLDWSPELQQKNLEWLDENLDSGRMAQRADGTVPFGRDDCRIV